MTSAEQLVLPDPGADTVGRHHAGGSDTEKGAAYRATPRTGTQRHAVLEAIAAAEDGLTDHEIAETTGFYLYSAAPRRGELLLGGWVEDSGHRRETPNGSTAIVWQLTADGRARMESAG